MKINWSILSGYFDADGTAGIYKKKRKNPRTGYWEYPTIAWMSSEIAPMQRIANFLDATISQTNDGMYRVQITEHKKQLSIAKKLVIRSINPRKKAILKSIIKFIENKTYRAPVTPELIEQIRRLYLEEYMTVQEIGHVINKSGGAVSSLMKFYNIPSRTCWESRRLRQKKAEVIMENQKSDGRFVYPDH